MSMMMFLAVTFAVAAVAGWTMMDAELRRLLMTAPRLAHLPQSRRAFAVQVIRFSMAMVVASLATLAVWGMATLTALMSG